MNIYIVVKNAQVYFNKFVPELESALKEAGCAVDKGLDILWSEQVFNYDVVYFQWPEFVISEKPTEKDIKRLRERIDAIKKRKILVVTQCHNLKPHDSNKVIETKLFDVIYGSCDLMVHMGEYSRNVLSEVYSQCQHILVPHHIYDHSFNFAHDKQSCRKVLNLSTHKSIILCFGAFRNDHERKLILELRKHIDASKYEIVVPGFYRKKILQKNLREGFFALINTIRYRSMGLRFSNTYLSDRDTEKYFSASDIVLIQRPDILNSGNLPMAFHAGKVVVGPNVGNVGCILSETGNPTFCPTDIQSLLEAIMSAQCLSDNGKGLENLQYAQDNWNTKKTAERLLSYIEKYEKV